MGSPEGPALPGSVAPLWAHGCIDCGRTLLSIWRGEQFLVILQHFYTSCVGVSGTTGFQVKAASPGIPPHVSERLMRQVAYRAPLSLDTYDISSPLWHCATTMWGHRRVFCSVASQVAATKTDALAISLHIPLSCFMSRNCPRCSHPFCTGVAPFGEI